MYNYGIQRIYRKMADDIGDAQLADGLIPEIAPVVFPPPFRDSPEWASAVVLSAWRNYVHFGDRQTLADHYENMRRYVEYLQNKSDNGILAYGLGDWYDNGPKPPGVSQLTSLGVTGTAIYYQDLRTLAKIADVLGRSDDAPLWTQRADQTRTAFNEKFYDRATGIYDRGSQTDFAMPLVVGLVPEDRRDDALAKLVADIRKNGNHTTAGDIGFHYVIQALSEGGRSDVIYALLSNPDPPSYAAQLANGETTLTEAWDANPRSSDNHLMLGHAEEWFYQDLAGIDFDLSRPPGTQLVFSPDACWGHHLGQGRVQDTGRCGAEPLENRIPHAQVRSHCSRGDERRSRSARSQAPNGSACFCWPAPF